MNSQHLMNTHKNGALLDLPDFHVLLCSYLWLFWSRGGPLLKPVEPCAYTGCILCYMASILFIIEGVLHAVANAFLFIS